MSKAKVVIECNSIGIYVVYYLCSAFHLIKIGNRVMNSAFIIDFFLLCLEEDRGNEIIGGSISKGMLVSLSV